MTSENDEKWVWKIPNDGILPSKSRAWIIWFRGWNYPENRLPFRAVYAGWGKATIPIKFWKYIYGYVEFDTQVSEVTIRRMFEEYVIACEPRIRTRKSARYNVTCRKDHVEHGVWQPLNKSRLKNKESVESVDDVVSVD